MQMVGGNGENQFRQYAGQNVGNLNGPKRRDAAYLQTQLLIAQKEEAGIQFQAKEFDLMAATANLDEIEEPEWSRHVTIVHQTKDLHTADYTQLYDFLKYNQKEVDELKPEQLAKTQDPPALMATSNNPYNFPVLNQEQPSFNQNYIIDPTTTTTNSKS
nr:Gag-Pol polyprotein [Tanacetum cinerariifolium]